MKTVPDTGMAPGPRSPWPVRVSSWKGPNGFATFCSILASLLLGQPATPASSHEAPPPLTFERDIRPLLKTHCFPCHGEGEKLKGGVDLRLRRLMLTNSDSGPVIVPGKPSESVLLKVVTSGEMPKSQKKLTPEQVATLERWIQQGAPTLRPEPSEIPQFSITEEEREFWSFQPVRRLAPPPVRHPQAVRTPIDAFVLAKLEANGLEFARPADKRSLIRRVTWDLTGLLPSPAQTAAFVAEDAPDAYERLVDRLLASPAYGERWARHWLDVAGYADSNGGTDTDSERAWAWRYRDYVIRSFNSDKPFDQLVTEQLAGDELVSRPLGELTGDTLDKVVATGFLRMAPDPTGDGPADADLARNQVIADTLQIVSTSLLGLTVQCAQCHDHRYDPIPQTDYYRLRAIFEPAFDWKHWKNPGERLISLMPAEDRVTSGCIETVAKEIDAEAQTLHDALIEKFVQKQLERVPEEMRKPVLAARRTPANQRTEEQKKLLRDYPTFQDGIILGEIDRDGAKQVEDIRKNAIELRAAKPMDPMVHGLVEEPGKKVETFLFHRGDHQQPRQPVTPGGLMVLKAGDEEFAPADPKLQTSGRRLALAKWLTNGQNPLTARVLVNRVWHHHFGAGIVSTLGDFGTLGSRPTHPELLDWLASEFVASGWKLKAFHRLIVTSTVYRQGSINPAAQAADPDNRWLGRSRLRRLDAEALRDALLAVSGHLNPAMYGPPVPVAVNPQGQFVVGAQRKDGNGDPTGVAELGDAELRRSVYVQVRRTMPVGVLEAFDLPALSPNCEARSLSTVPAQALMLMNDPFVLDRSRDLAQRLRQDCPGSVRDQVALLWRLLFAAEASESEIQKSLVYLAEQTETLRATIAKKMADTKDTASKAQPAAADSSLQALATLCQAVLGSTRFLYLE